jgi:hypothetical protein
VPKLSYLNTNALMRPHVHGKHSKDLIVLHETVGGDVAGWADINGVEKFLASKDYGIHGMTDLEGHVAWARGLGNAIFWQAGGVNERSVGIENVSNAMLRSPSNPVRKAIWLARNKQLDALAKLIAAICNTKGIPCRYSDGTTPGITSHWDVSQHFALSEGHSDCWPVHKGGYFPMLFVIYKAKAYKALGYTL